MPLSLQPDCSQWPQPAPKRANLTGETTDRRAGCGKSASPVRREEWRVKSPFLPLFVVRPAKSISKLRQERLRPTLPLLTELWGNSAPAGYQDVAPTALAAASTTTRLVAWPSSRPATAALGRDESRWDSGFRSDCLVPIATSPLVFDFPIHRYDE